MLNIVWSDFISNESIHKDNKLPFIIDFMIKLANNFYSRCFIHPNDLVKSLGNYDYNALEYQLKHKLPKPIDFLPRHNITS